MTLPVVVGIDGSKHAVSAAVWGSAEASSRGTVLRLVYVTSADVDDIDSVLDDIRAELDKARLAIENAGKPVEVESEILRGEPATALIDVSRAAQLMCVGAKGARDSGKQRRGSTAAIVAESAFCPVAVIRERRRPRRRPRGKSIVALLDESPLSHGVLQTAVEEGRRRHAPVLALTSWALWSARPAEVEHDGDDLRVVLDRYLLEAEIDSAATGIGAMRLPATGTAALDLAADVGQLVVVGQSNPAMIDELVGPHGRRRLRKTNCSVIVFRELRTAPAAQS